MTKMFDYDHGDPFPASFTDALQEFISTYASPNFKLVANGTTGVQVAAGSGNDQVAIGISGKYRWITASVTAAHPGGASGTYNVWATAEAQQNPVNTPTTDTDPTNYAFGLKILPSASTPSGSGAEAIYRKVGEVVWSGTAITDIRQTVGARSLSANEIITSYIADLAVTTAKLANAAVTAAKLASDAVGTAQIQALAVTAAKLASQAVETAKIMDLAVTTQKLADLSVTTPKIAASAVTSDKLGSGAVTDAKVATGLDASKITVPLARVRRTTDMVIANNGQSYVDWEIETLDTDGMFSLATPRRLYVTRQGTYRITVWMSWGVDTAASGQRGVFFELWRESPLALIETQWQWVQAWTNNQIDNDLEQCVQWDFAMFPGYYIEMSVANQGSGGSQTLREIRASLLRIAGL